MTTIRRAPSLPRTTIRTGRAAAALVLLLATATAGAAPAPRPFDGSMRVESVVGREKPTSVFELSLLGAMRFAIDRSGDLCGRFIEALGKPGAVVPGETLYDIACSDPGNERLSILPGSGAMAFDYERAGISLTFTSTQPLVGRWGDPRFSVAFDLHFLFSLVRPALPASGVRLGAIEVVAVNADVDSHNLIADLGMLAASVAESFGGPALDGLVQELLTDQLRQVRLLTDGGAGLVVLNAVLRDLFDAGFVGFDWRFDGRALVLAMKARPRVLGALDVSSLTTTVRQSADRFVHELGALPSEAVAEAATVLGSPKGGITPQVLVGVATSIAAVTPPPPAPSVFSNPLDSVALNPQPLPPRETTSVFGPVGTLGTTVLGSPVATVALNPQPLPPRTVLGASLRLR